MTANVTQEKIQEVARKIAERFQPEKIILFGSYAWGRPTVDSDVDLFIVKATGDTRALARAIDGFVFPRPFPLDVLVYRPETVARKLDGSDFFLRDIFNKGKILYAGQ